MNNRNLLKPLIATILIANSASVIAKVSETETEAAKLDNQSTCLSIVTTDVTTVATNTDIIATHSGQWIGIPARGEYASYIGVVPFITLDQIQALQLHFPYR